MIRDYGGSRGGMARAGRRPPGRGECRDGGGAWFNALGMILLLLSLAGVLSALWVAWALRSELSELSRQELRLEQLQAENGTLMEQRDGLSSRERIEMKAAELGLFPPRSNQLR